MAKITITGFLGSFLSVIGIDNRFNQVQDELNDKVLYRDNPVGEPNEMNNDLDMNDNDVINVGSIRLRNGSSFVEDIISVSPNLIVTDDGEGLYTLDAINLGGGNVFNSIDNTYAPNTTQFFPAIEVDGVDVSDKFNTIDSEVDAVETTANSANSTANTANATADSAQSTANSAQSTASNALTSATAANAQATSNLNAIANINTRPYITLQGGGGNKRYRRWSDGRVEAWGTNQNVAVTNGQLVTFPTTFPTDNISITANYDNGATGDLSPITVGSKSVSGFQLGRANPSSTINWYAISL